MGTLAAQPPDDWCRPKRGRCVLHPVGTRGGVWWMRGPCACPGGMTLGLGSVRPSGLIPTRTSTRPPPFSTSTPCPYRTEADLPNHSPIRLSKIIRMYSTQLYLRRLSLNLHWKKMRIFSWRVTLHTGIQNILPLRVLQ